MKDHRIENIWTWIGNEPIWVKNTQHFIVYLASKAKRRFILWSLHFCHCVYRFCVPKTPMNVAHQNMFAFYALSLCVLLSLYTLYGMLIFHGVLVEVTHQNIPNIPTQMLHVTSHASVFVSINFTSMLWWHTEYIPNYYLCFRLYPSIYLIFFLFLAHSL